MVLDLDGEYQLAASGGNADSGGHGEAGASTGGVSSGGGGGAGGAGGAVDGGQATGGSGGKPLLDSGHEASVDPMCRPGWYTGEFSGEHAPSVTVVGLGLPISGGGLSFRLAPGEDVLEITNGTLGSTFAWGQVQGTLAGTYDCRTGVLDGTISGSFAAAPFFADFEGTLTGELFGDASTRVWQEHETVFTMSSGSGTWFADWAEP